MNFIYVSINVSDTEPYVVGRIGRAVSELENAPPEDEYREFIHDTWKAAVVVVDPTEHGDGQKLAIQFHSDVGRPLSLAPRLLQALEKNHDFVQYRSAVHPITNTEKFWDFVKRNEGKVTHLRFELEVPNMFGGDDEYSKEMKAFRDKENAQTVAIEITNPDGIDTDTDRVKYTAEKAMGKGTGKLKARAMGKNNRFTSQFQQESTRVPIDFGSERRPLITRAAELADRILGRDEN